MITIVSAAIRGPGEVIFYLPKPSRHSDIIHAMASTRMRLPITGEQGFLTSDGEFVTREAARTIALAAGQVKAENLTGSIFCSEELW